MAAMRLLGLVLLMLGALGTCMGIFQWIDPSDAKLADDADPFGDPASGSQSALLVLAYLGLAAIGAYLMRRFSSRNEPHK